MSDAWTATGDDPAPWRCLKGGVVVGITKRGAEVTFDIEIPRLRRRFAGQGSTLRVQLTACTELVFQPWDEPPIEDPGGIIGSAPDVVDAASTPGMGALAPGMKVACVSGELQLRYAELRMELEDGTPVSLDDMATAAAADDLPWSTPRSSGGGGVGAS